MVKEVVETQNTHKKIIDSLKAWPCHFGHNLVPYNIKFSILWNDAHDDRFFHSYFYIWLS